MNKPIVSLVVGFRDRDMDRVKRFLASLQKQTVQDLELIFVDYGSSAEIAIQARKTVEAYPFCRYIYSDTRGYPWNRSRALNTGAHFARADYVMTTDVDILFPRDFLETAISQISHDRVVHCYPYFLPPKFSDWENYSAYAVELPKGDFGFKGGCQIVFGEVFAAAGGFDEYYQYWGLEDLDLSNRLSTLGIQEYWLNDLNVYIYHQWHPRQNYLTSNFFPDGYWERYILYYHTKKNKPTMAQNEWGRVQETEERPIYQFLNFEKNQIIESEKLIWFNEMPYQNDAISNFSAVFFNMLPGQVIALPRAFLPYANRWLDRVIKIANMTLNRLKINSKIEYARNRLHSFAAELALTKPELVADYYLGFPCMDGVTLLMRS